MAAYANVTVRFFHGTDPDVMETQIDTYITALDSTTEKVISVFPFKDGIVIVSGA
jgi:hypothetical protein